MRNLQRWELQDLVQEVLLKAMLKLDKFRGESTLKTFVVTLARNHLLNMAHRIRLAPRPGMTGDEAESKPGYTDSVASEELRDETRALLEWLEENPTDVPWGREVLQLLLWNAGNFEYVAMAMCIKTAKPWTVARVRRTVQAIRKTPRGLALCGSIGLGQVKVNGDKK